MDYDFFWRKIQEDFGDISPHLRNILRIQNLCNKSLTTLSRDSLQAIVHDMRNMADFLSQEASKGGLPLSNIYGARWAKDPKNFTFLEGESLSLVHLAEHLKKRDITNFLKFSRSQSSATAIALQPPHLSPKMQQSSQHPAESTEEFKMGPTEMQILGKIQRFYSSQNVHDPEFESFRASLSDLKVRLLPITNGIERAAITCPVCTREGRQCKKITLKRDQHGNWHIYSFTRHCHMLHCMPKGSRKRQYSEIEDADAESLEDVPVDAETIKIEFEDSNTEWCN
ncbi:uncharacterized protein LOC131692770 [Topomyia yanbarensis]|uniref:uncharacterized protein LOC131692770 n=1 Tax=Topomyia yanbarensis TaxID=2498891 RepID=UPI00273BE2B3|nr:uncharacterized protein LOC131692770 [Topomyia yanbarensis]